VNRAYLSLGSNIDPEGNLPMAVRYLTNHGSVQSVSTVWESAPIGFADQPNYLNAAVLLETALTADALCQDAISPIESQMGRIRDEHQKDGPRPIDIDIMLFNRDILKLDARYIPHPEVLDRLFVAMSLAQIDPCYIHPETGQTLQEVAEQLRASGDEMRRRSDIMLLPQYIH